MKRAIRPLALAAMLSALGATGCAGQKALVADATKLGSVIVYRNGVAYFERYAAQGEKAITLRVPHERVDDFLKSLTIIDEQTGKALPVSYPTFAAFDGYVAMTIKLPPHAGRLRITYVTESPAWKPSYRVVLGDAGEAKLQGWAVIDNVSGEDWNKVRIGVGSTSALSFRYDLHSVRLVERETLGGGGELAIAPPTGGSPYAVASNKVRVLGSISAGELGTFGQAQTASLPPPADADEGERAEQTKVPKQQRRSADLRTLSQNIKAGKHRVRVEGYAQSGDADPQQAALSRANFARDRLIENGVPADQIDVVATGKVSSDVVRILAADGPVAPSGSKEMALAAKDSQPAGHAHFVSDKPMSIAAEHSAMVSILNAATSARRVYFFDPISERGSKTFAFSAVRLENPTDYTLDGGPFTVYTKGQFLGEGLSEPILPRSTAFIPYALDRSVVVEPALDTREEIDKLVTIQRGIATAETRRIRRSKITVSNRGQEEAEVYVRHQVAAGYELMLQDPTQKIEKLGAAHLFPVRVAPGGAVELVIEESTPLMKTVDIRTDLGVNEIRMFLQKRDVEPELKKKLDDVLAAHKSAENLSEKIRTFQDQMAVYRTRVDELTAQLASLRKVPQAEKLRSNLSSKMEEISDKLQKATIDVTDLEGQLMTVRIGLQDKLADLTLEKDERHPKAVASKP